MIDQPRYVITVRPAEIDQIVASADTTRRISEFLSRLRLAGAKTTWEIQVHEEIPAHAGLGSGTQLGLAIATAISRLCGERHATIKELARRIGRSARSAIGTSGFAEGGLISHGFEMSPQRCDFPTDWRFILVTPRDHQGLSGDVERNAFREMPPMSDPLIQQLSRRQSDMITASAHENFGEFSRALFDFGQAVGEYFAPIQDGKLADPRMAALAEKLRAEGIAGVGQTSWGPTLFAACESDDDARALMKRVRESEWGDCDVRIAKAMNHGANVTDDE